ncbi:MAG: hypothetical protein RQ899_08400 [Pseudomonadales bacterium]|nr:hypothetical protein [Pseudomonadales bacterium]
MPASRVNISGVFHPRRDALRRSLLPITLDTLCLVFFYLALVTPNRISWMMPLSFVYFPLEGLLFGLVLLALPERAAFGFRGLMALLLGAGIIFKLADMAAYLAFARPFNPVLDAYLLGDAMNLLTGAIGRLGALVTAALIIVLALLIFVLAFIVLGRLRALLLIAPGKSATWLSMGLLVWLALSLSPLHRSSKSFYELMALHVNDTFSGLADIRYFRSVVSVDAYADTPGDALFQAIRGKDVLLVFIESYGRTVLDNPDFASHVRPVLEQANIDLAAHAIFARSAYLTSPTVGGISWLAHGTALSGLWINSQVRYDALVRSRRQTLNSLFRRAGWRTVAVMPAITQAWPEGDYFGYDQIYTATDLGYQGEPFNWVTMPDQYTLSAFQALERRPGPRRPVMAEMALISTHAPWTPLPTMVDWAQVGDGSIFTAQANAGESPEVVWKEETRIREQYRLSVEYALADLVSYAITYGDDNLVILMFGDHQPAPLVTGDTDNRDVIVHLIARDPKVMDAVQGWHWSDGMLPAADAPVWRMDEVRDRIISAFSAPAESRSEEDGQEKIQTSVQPQDQTVDTGSASRSQ